jgi:NADPH2:quinone reductase
VQITELSGPLSTLGLADLPEPEPSHMLTPGSGVVVDVHAAGISFPELLQTPRRKQKP